VFTPLAPSYDSTSLVCYKIQGRRLTGVEASRIIAILRDALAYRRIAAPQRITFGQNGRGEIVLEIVHSRPPMQLISEMAQYRSWLDTVVTGALPQGVQAIRLYPEN
jgi:hypothetical protein